jgi:protein gp37
MGVTVKSQKHTYRIDGLAKIPSKIKFLSIEPLLSYIPNLPFESIDWAIVSGESGTGVIFEKLMNTETLDVKLIGKKGEITYENKVISKDFIPHLKQFYEQAVNFK